MKKQIVNVSIAQTAKVAAALYFVVSLPLVAIMMLSTLVTGQTGLHMIFMVLLPVFYVVFGFIFTAIFAWLYNLVAARIGGIEYTTVEVGR
ncbi:MAG: hypothetical protein H7176_02495 [Bdellovibrionales bacterium]|nr:hypothetical protein [Massilia sp.]